VKVSDKSFDPLVVDQATAARMLGVSVSTLRRWGREGRGPRVIRLSRLVRYRPSDLRRFLRATTDGQ
jgi:predicted site-specific integrase-resolvase